MEESTDVKNLMDIDDQHSAYKRERVTSINVLEENPQEIKLSVNEARKALKELKLKRTYILEIIKNLETALSSIDISEEKKKIVYKKEIKKLEEYLLEIKNIDAKIGKLTDYLKNMLGDQQEIMSEPKQAVKLKTRSKSKFVESSIKYVRDTLNKEITDPMEYVLDFSDLISSLMKKIYTSMNKIAKESKKNKVSHIKKLQADTVKAEEQVNVRRQFLRMSKRKVKKIKSILYPTDNRGTMDKLKEIYQGIVFNERRVMLRVNEETLEKLLIAVKSENEALTESELNKKIKNYYKEIEQYENGELSDRIERDIRKIIKKLEILLDLREAIDEDRRLRQLENEAQGESDTGEVESEVEIQGDEEFDDEE